MNEPIVIDEFRGPYGFLSNFHREALIYNNFIYPSSEHAYQAAKCMNKQGHDMVAHAKSPSEAKQLGQMLTMWANWDDVKNQIMLDILRAKFNNGLLAQKLMWTRNATLIEGNTWNDTYWGVCRGVGQNHLGLLLMQVRKELQDAIRF